MSKDIKNHQELSSLDIVNDQTGIDQPDIVNEQTSPDQPDIFTPHCDHFD